MKRKTRPKKRSMVLRLPIASLVQVGGKNERFLSLVPSFQRKGVRNMTQGNDAVFSFNPFSFLSQHDPQRFAFFRQAEPRIPPHCRQADRPGIYMAMDLYGIDSVL